MPVKLPWVLFGASLLLNLFFAGGVVYSKATAERLREEPASRMAFVVDEFGLTETERESLVALREAVSAGRAQMRREGEPIRKALLAAMRKPAYDRERVGGLLGGRADLFADFLTDALSQLHGFLMELPEEKRDDVFALMDQERRFIFRLLRKPHTEETR